MAESGEAGERGKRRATPLLAVFRANDLFSVLVEGSGRRDSVFVLKSLLNATEGNEVFK